LKRFIHFTILLGVTFVGAVTRADQAAGAAVPHSPARDQKSIGFCWAYSLTGLIEGERMRAGGAPDVRVSGEYLGFYHMYYEIKDHIPWFRTLAKRLKDGGLQHDDGSVEDAYERIYVHNHFFRPDEASEEGRALKEIALVGAVPESVFAMSWNDDQESALEDRIKNFIKANLFDEAKLDVYGQGGTDGFNETLYQEFGKAFGSKPPRPTDSFTYRGTTYTPIQFLARYLNFDPAKFKEVIATKATHDHDVELVRSVMQKGISVPLGFTVFKDKDAQGNATGDEIVKTGIFTSAPCPNGHCTKEDAGHEVLAVNWMDTKDGSTSAFIVKNSWGKTGFNDRGQNTPVTADKGFYILETEYLLNSLTGSKDPWTYVVPLEDFLGFTTD
jgi:hypothetical protein